MVQDSDELNIENTPTHIKSCLGIPKPQESQRLRWGMGEAGRRRRERWVDRKALMAKDHWVVTDFK